MLTVTVVLQNHTTIEEATSVFVGRDEEGNPSSLTLYHPSGATKFHEKGNFYVVNEAGKTIEHITLPGLTDPASPA